MSTVKIPAGSAIVAPERASPSLTRMSRAAENHMAMHARVTAPRAIAAGLRLRGRGVAVSISSVEESESELSAGQSKSPLRARSSAA